MEGRVPPAAADSSDDPPLSPHSPPPVPPRQPTPSSDPQETYIVQIPRDQIYRVPPPDHARIVERYRRPSYKKERGGGRCCLWVFIAILVIAAIVGAGVAVVQVFFNPKTPEFSVTKVLVKNPTSSHTKHAHPKYEISLKADNPNERMGVSYEDGGKTSLSFHNKQIAGGKYPSLTQDAKDSTTVHLTLDGSDAALPTEVEKSTKDEKSHSPVSLSLTINMPAKMKSLISFSKDVTVTCEFKVSTLASGTKILSEKCDTKF